ncbi:endoglucanase 10-like [Aristolochia californica]|uniref:endoglucanase 10-like n=1 Tax=Aristolochia californica TaxID=171875 RepID=UPI0035DCE6CE
MPDTKSLLRSTDPDGSHTLYVHSVSEAGRLVPSASRWNSIQIDYGLHPVSSSYDVTPSKYSKSVAFNLVVTDKTSLKRFITISISLVLLILTVFLILKFLPHKEPHSDSAEDLKQALSQALLFFDAQKSGSLPANNLVNFRGNSGLHDGNSSDTHVNLVGGFYDSGNNIKFGFPAAYTITLLSWSVIEYNKKYEAIGELDHVKDIIQWGSDYLLKVFEPPNSTTDTGILYSQVGSTDTSSEADNDINCWQRPEDMSYLRPVSVCTTSASDLAGETAAALSAASIVFKNEKLYSEKLVHVAQKLFDFATQDKNQGVYTQLNGCGGAARKYYNSSGYLDELVWAGTWLFFATGNSTYLQYTVHNFQGAVEAELVQDKGVLDWNSKLAANVVLLSRLRYFIDPGYPYETTLRTCSNITTMLMCSYLHDNFNMTAGGLILLRPSNRAPLQYAATAAFLAKLYKDYLHVMQILGGSCSSTESFSLQMLQAFSASQVGYILGDNPLKLSYLVGFSNKYPAHVHHRAASIPPDDQSYSCAAGKRWLFSKDPNPNLLLGAMVAGPDKNDKFSDKRDAPEYTEPTISGNAGLVAALVAVLDPPSRSNDISGGLDKLGIFTNIHT